MQERRALFITKEHSIFDDAVQLTSLDTNFKIAAIIWPVVTERQYCLTMQSNKGYWNSTVKHNIINDNCSISYI